METGLEKTIELSSEFLERLQLFNSQHEEQIAKTEIMVRSDESSIKNAIELVSWVSSHNDDKSLLEVNKEMAMDFIETLERFSEIMRGETSGLMVKAFGPVRDSKKEQEQWRLEFASLLGAGILALALAERLEDRELFEKIIKIAAIPDGPSVLVRRALTKTLDLWNPSNPLEGIPEQLEKFSLKDHCVVGLQESGFRLGRYLQSARKIMIVEANADGIKGLIPNMGLPGDLIIIDGQFPAKDPDIQIAFVRSDGLYKVASIWNWDPTEIQVLVPDDVDEGPVGFYIYDSGSLSQAGDPTAALEFGSFLKECLGPFGASVAGGFERIPPFKQLTIRQSIPVLPGGENIFYASPIIDNLSRNSSHEGDPLPLVLTGRRFQSSDQVEVGGILCPTTFINATSLKFSIKNVPCGRRSIRVRRGSRRSNALEITVRAAISPNQDRRVKPSNWISISGSGFAKDEVYAILRNGMNGERLNENIISLTNMSIFIRRPNPPPLRNKRGEKITVDIYDSFGMVGSIVFSLDTYRIVTFGDSIIWGQGLTESTKFTTLLADYLQTQFGNTIGVYNEDRLAHSGAVIMRSSSSTDPIPNAANPPPTGDFEGERPNQFSSITNQVRAWEATPQLKDEAEDIDLVIIDGGINDVGVMNILNPFNDDIVLINDTNAACGAGMTALLSTVKTIFPNAKVIVTGYYPIVSTESDLNSLFFMAVGLGVLASMGLTMTLLGSSQPGAALANGILLLVAATWVKSRLVTRSSLFESMANASLAVSVANQSGTSVRFAKPQFNSKNSIFAPDSFLFGVNVGIGTLNAVDPVAPKRLQLSNCANDLTCNIASIGHPNERGAQLYFEAIRNVL